MTLTDAWLTYMAVLRDRAPATAASVRPPRLASEREDVERATTPWTEELREFFALHDGQDIAVGTDHYVGTLLPDLGLLSLEEVLYTHRSCRENLHPVDDLGEDWPGIARAQYAGETAEMFLASYVPVAEDGAGDFRYVDTRAGHHQGCVRYFAAESADQGGPIFDSLTEYVDSVRRSVEAGSEHSGLVPTFYEGALIWEVDFSERPGQEQAPAPTVLRLPFALTGFLPSQVTDEDDLIDLDVVRRTVVETARSLHPGSIVEDARAVYRRVPRQRGVDVNWSVWIDGADKFYMAIVTGVGNEVIVHEVPPGGFEIRVDD